MRKCIGIFVAVLILVNLLPADLMDLYKKGTVNLVPDPGFGKNTDWEELIYYRRRHIAVADDGCVFVSNAKQHNIYKFDSRGNLVKTFGRKGLGPGDLFFPSQLSIAANKYLVINEYATNRRLSIFDLAGNYVKVIKTDWPVFESISLKNNVIALLTYQTEIKGNKKERIAKIFTHHIDTGEEKPIYARKLDITQTKTVSGGRKVYYYEEVFFLSTNSGNILLGFNNNPDLAIYSPAGEKLKSFRLQLKQHKITAELKERHYNIRLKRAWDNPNMPKRERASFAKNMKRNKSKILSEFPEFYPYYTDILIDGEDNILVLKNRYVDEPDWKWTPIYQVYSPDGELKCEFGMNFGKYDTKIWIPREFSNGFLYGIFERETGEEYFYELVKMRLN